MFKTILHVSGTLEVKEFRTTLTKKDLESISWAAEHGYSGVVLKKTLNPLEVHTVYIE